MPILYTYGNLFDTDAEAIVNTVNCVGVMGKGVALEFKKRWPDNFKAYKAECDAKRLTVGKMFVFDQGADMFEAKQPPRFLINFPTKDHWRGKSKMSYIVDGLDDFIIQLRKHAIQSVALPPLGCGNGGLPWQDVKAVLEQKLADIHDIDFIVYAPQENKQDVLRPEHEDYPTLEMTLPRAVLVKTISEFEPFFGGALTRVPLQKIVYFLQEIGLDFNLAFKPNTHGPYSETLKSVLYKLEENHFIQGYSDEEPQITATKGAVAAAHEFLSQADSSPYEAMIQRLSLLIDGYENPIGMELLASVHYLTRHEGMTDKTAIIQAIQNWNERKKEYFTPPIIERAYHRLEQDGFL